MVYGEVFDIIERSRVGYNVISTVLFCFSISFTSILIVLMAKFTGYGTHVAKFTAFNKAFKLREPVDTGIEVSYYEFQALRLKFLIV